MKKDNILEVINLCKKIKSHTIIDSVTLTIKVGEIVGLVGPNGSGKTTIMKSILGLQSIQKGDIIYKGNSIHSKNYFPLMDVGALIEDPGYYPYLTLKENIKLFRGNDIDELEVNKLSRMLGIETAQDKKLSEFSLGMKQKYGIILAIIASKGLVILDEPMNALDPMSMQGLREIISEYSRKGVSFLISSHIVSELIKIVDRVLILRDGSLINELNNKDRNEKFSVKLVFKEKIPHKYLKGRCHIVDDYKMILQGVSKEYLAEVLNKIGKSHLDLSQVTIEQDTELQVLQALRGER